jgi:hypothetical protein
MLLGFWFADSTNFELGVKLGPILADAEVMANMMALT